MKNLSVAIVSLLLWALPLRGANTLEPVASVINDQTYIVVRVNVDQLDIKAVFDKFTEFVAKDGTNQPLVADAVKNIAQARDAFSSWIEQFRLAGGRSIYALAYAPDGASFALAFPLSKPANIETLKKLILPHAQQIPIGPMEAKEKEDLLLVAPKVNLDRLLAAKPCPRKDLETAFESVAGMQLQWAAAPVTDQRRVIQDMMPKMTLNKEDFNADVLTRGLIWAAAGQNFSPNMGISVIIQSADAAAAQELRHLIDAFSQHCINQEQYKAAAPLLRPLLAVLLPQVEKDRLALRIQDPALNEMVQNLLRPALAEQKSKAERIIGINNVKQILLACIMYSDERKKWPEKLTDLGSYINNMKTLQSPRHPERPVGFEYLMPGKNYDKYPVSEHLIVYESFTTWPEDGLTLGFMDGHCEISKNQERFEKLLKETKARNAGQ